jgi:IPT/TIG domain
MRGFLGSFGVRHGVSDYKQEHFMILTSINPTQGRTSGGDLVQCNGRGFASGPAPTVYFGDLAATVNLVVNDSLISTVTPPSLKSNLNQYGVGPVNVFAGPTAT